MYLSIHAEIKFNPVRHTYTHDGRLLPSVTGIIKKLVPPFDKAGLSAKVAAKQGKRVEDVLAEWAAKGELGLATGTTLHNAIQAVLT